MTETFFYLAGAVAIGVIIAVVALGLTLRAFHIVPGNGSPRSGDHADGPPDPTRHSDTTPRRNRPDE